MEQLTMAQALMILIGGFLTLCIFSFLYKDNPFYRFAEHLYVGVSAGYLFARGTSDVLYKKLWVPLLNPSPGFTSDFYLLIPLTLGIFMAIKQLPRVGWISRWAIAFVVGGTIGLTMTSRFKSDVVKQVAATVAPFQVRSENVEAKREKFLSVSSISSVRPEERILDTEEWFFAWVDYSRVWLKSNFSVSSSAMLSQDFILQIQDLQTHLFAAIRDSYAFEDETRKTLSVLEKNRGGFLAAIASQEKEISDYFARNPQGTFQKIRNEVFFMDQNLSRLKKSLEAIDAASKKVLNLLSFLEGSREEMKTVCSLAVEGADQKNVESVLNRIFVAKDALSGIHKEVLQVLSDIGAEMMIFNLEPSWYESVSIPDPRQFLGFSSRISVFDQAERAVKTWNRQNVHLPFTTPWYSLFVGFVIAFGVLSILTYFFFSTEHKGAVGFAARIGIWFLMISFGSSFGYTIMARISLLIGRMSYMIDQVAPALRLVLFGS